MKHELFGAISIELLSRWNFPIYIESIYRKGVKLDVKTLCLGILSRVSATGYEIKKQCEEGPFAYFYAAGFGSIYPALNALLKDGQISVEEIGQNGKPSKKVYSISASGRQTLIASLSEPPAPDRLRSDFLFILFFGQFLPARDIDTLIGDRITWLRDRQAEMESCRDLEMPAGSAFTLGYGLAVYEAAATYLENHRHELVGASLQNEVRSENGIAITEPERALS